MEGLMTLYLPLLFIVVFGGFVKIGLDKRVDDLAERLDECCEKLEEMRKWIAIGTDDTYSAARWIELAHEAICDPGEKDKLCGNGGGDPTSAPRNPPPFA